MGLWIRTRVSVVTPLALRCSDDMPSDSMNYGAELAFCLFFKQIRHIDLCKNTGNQLQMPKTVFILSEQLTHCTCTQPIYKQHTQLPHPHIVTYPLAPLHPNISTCTSITPVLILYCNYFTSIAYLLPLPPNSSTFAHIVHRFLYCVIDCTFVYA